MGKVTISLEFDSETQTVSNVVVNGLPQQETVTKKIIKRASTVKDEVPKNVVLTGSSLKLNQELLDLLEIETNKGKKLVLEVTGKKVFLLNPVITGSKGGNLVTNAMTIACKGKVADQLKVVGTEFTFLYKGPGEVELIPVGGKADIAPKKEQPEVSIPTNDEVKEVVLEGLGVKEGDFDFDFDFG